MQRFLLNSTTCGLPVGIGGLAVNEPGVRECWDIIERKKLVHTLKPYFYWYALLLFRQMKLYIFSGPRKDGLFFVARFICLCADAWSMATSQSLAEVYSMLQKTSHRAQAISLLFLVDLDVASITEDIFISATVLSNKTNCVCVFLFRRKKKLKNIFLHIFLSRVFE